MDYLQIPLDDIFCDEEFNCRDSIPKYTLLGLIDSIRNEGLLNPITVQADPEGRAKYVIVTGHRRYLACKHLGWKTIPCFVGEFSETQAHISNLVENLQRQDLTFREEAQGVVELGRKNMWSWGRVAQALSKSEEWVNIRRMYMALPEDIRELVDSGILVQHDIRECWSILYGDKQTTVTADELRERLQLIKERRQSASEAITLDALRKEDDQRKHKAKPARVRTQPEMRKMQQAVYLANGREHNLTTAVLAWILGDYTLEQVLDYCPELEDYYNDIL